MSPYEDEGGAGGSANSSALIHDGAGRYLLHLRDDYPHIWAPGEFSLLGGGREPGDRTPEDTLRRELAEEVPGLALGEVAPLAVERVTAVDGSAVVIQIFDVEWDGDPDTLGLREGVLLRWFRPEQLGRLRLRPSTRQLIEEHWESVRRRRERARPGGAVVRRAEPADGPELARLRAIMLESAGVPTTPAWAAECARWFAERLDGDPRFGAFVADDGSGRLLALAIGQYALGAPRPGELPNVGHITSVVTDPAHRRQGHARHVVQAVHDWLTARSCRRIGLTASPEAESLYRDLGYTDPVGPVALVWRAG
ncbi:GNAT family N-acetyltransferase [Kitasatospora sp. NPDC049285]|uniref:GNAT family N-acetyltransferase n=1 Tax=Kitasatospora sp. NPDC049285 TaxID=3157096 RepID=UPI003427A84D